MTTTDGSKSPEEIRAEIERTRGNLGLDVDALADKVNPSSIAHRQTDKVKSRLTSVKESIMGSVDDIKGAGSSASDSLMEAPHAAATAAKGNAVAVGLVVFGLGLLVSSLIPASDREQELATTAKDKAAPAIDAVKGSAQDFAENMKAPVSDAVGSVKESAQDAAGTVRDDAQSAAADVKDSAQESKDAIQNDN